MYGVTLGPDGWYVTLQDRLVAGPVEWHDAQYAADGLNKIAASPNDARPLLGVCEAEDGQQPGTGLEAAETL